MVIPWGAVISGGLQAATTGTLGALNYGLSKSQLNSAKKISRARLNMDIESHGKAMTEANLNLKRIGEEIERSIRIGDAQEIAIMDAIGKQVKATGAGSAEDVLMWQDVTSGAIRTGALDVIKVSDAEAAATVISASPQWGPFSGANPALLIGGILAGIYILRR